MATVVSLRHVQDLVSEYLFTALDFEAFAERFAVLFYDIEQTGSPLAVQLAYRIEAKLADVSVGLSSIESLRNYLAGVAVPANTPIGPSVLPLQRES